MKKISLSTCTVLILFFTCSAQPLSFTWSMGEHFEECAKAYNAITHQYDKNILKPKEGWVVKFEASNPSCAHCTYTWDIQGTGENASYHKSYTTDLLKLYAEIPVNNNKVYSIGGFVSLNTKDTGKISGQKHPVNFQKMNTPPGSGTPQGRPKPTAFQVERFPGTGSYKITLTARQAEGGGIQTSIQTVTLVNYLIVCIGDSFNSGEGNPSYPGEAGFLDTVACSMTTLAAAWYASGDDGNTIDLDQSASWLEELAHRSLSSGAAIAARQVELNDPHSVVTFIDFATSGADTRKGLLTPQYDWQRWGQIEEVKNLIGNTPVTALLMAIGINDMGFTNMLHDATIKTIDQHYKQSVADVKLVQLGSSYDLVNDAIRRNINVKNIFLTEYPWPIFSTGNADHAGGCGLFDVIDQVVNVGITSNEALLFHLIGQDLSRKMKQEAADHNWIFIDGIADQFKGHGYCAGNSYYIHAEESCKTQGNIKGTMHPNIQGHEIIAQKIYQKLHSILLPQFVPSPNPN